MSDTCATCRYFKPEEKREHGHVLSSCCARHPPQIIRDGEFSVWPSVYKSNWCGEHKRKADDTASGLAMTEMLEGSRVIGRLEDRLAALERKVRRLDPGADL